MAGWKEWKDFFSLSRKDRVGLMLMAVLALLFFVLPDLPIAPGWPGNGSDTAWMSEWRAFLDSAEESPGAVQAVSSSPAEQRQARSSTLFEFDPNTLDAEGWRQLGLREKTIQIILNYRSKGGRFRQPDDLGRIYSLFPDEWERLKPYVRIESAGSSDGTTSFSKRNDGSLRKNGHYAPVVVDINTADSAAWEALPGIGPKLAQRIIRFREALGGFYSIDQVREVYALPDSVFRKIEPRIIQGNQAVRKIRINEAGINELSAHPYIRSGIAKMITRFREQHGPYHGPEDLYKLAALNADQIEKILPYLSFEQ